MPNIDTWHPRWRTLQAMALLCVARLAVQLLPFRHWHGTLGRVAPEDRGPDDSVWAVGTTGQARRLAAHVERGATRLPFATKCLPRAMALCWLLRLAGIAYVLKIAARPAGARQAGRGADDTLHAWVESSGSIMIGALPGPWLVVLMLQG